MLFEGRGVHWRITAAACAVLLLNAPLHAAAQDEPSKAAGSAPRLLVYPFTTSGLAESIGTSLADIVANQITRTGLYDVVTWYELRELFDHQALLQMLGSEQTDALLEASAKVDAEYIVSGSVQGLGNAYAVSLTLMRASDAQVQHRIAQTLYGDSAQVSAALRAASQALVSDLSGHDAQSVSERAFAQVLLSEVPKTFNVRLLPGYRMPLGAAQTERGVYLVRAPQGVLTLSAGYMLRQFLEVGLTASAARGESQPALQGRIGLVDQTTDPVSGEPRTQSTINVLDTRPHFRTTEVQTGLHTLLRPSQGVFLPFASLMLGVVGDRREVRGQQLSAVLPALGGTACPGYATYEPSVAGCEVNATLSPLESARWRLGGAAAIAVGAEWLLTRHLALHARLGYELRMWQGQRNLIMSGEGSYDGPPAGSFSLTDVYQLPGLEHSVVASIGLLGYL